MKKRLTTIIAWALMIVMLLLITPSLFTRLDAEKANKNVNIAVLYNDLVKKVSKEKLWDNLEEYKKIGVDTVAVMEEDLNALVSAGEVTCIKYNVLLHKYDEESVYVGDVIKERFPNVTLDSYVVLVKREELQEKLSYLIPRRFGEDDYSYIGGLNAITEAGLRVPEDISAVGYDGIHLARILKLTTYSQNTQDLGRIAAERLIQLIEHPKTAQPTRILVPGGLLEGASVKEIKE